MKKRKIAYRIIAVCICALFIFMTGCAQEAMNDVTEDESAIETPLATEYPPKPAEGGVLKLSMRKPATLNPLLNEDVTVDAILKLMFIQLMTLDENMRPTPWLAADINFASDGSNVLITLRDLFWSDGQPITSDDLIFSINTLKNAPEGAIYKQCVENILNVSRIDEKTVKINYTHAFAAAEYLLCFPLIPQHYYINEVNPGSEKNMAPLGNFLYIFDSYDGRDVVKLSVNKNLSNVKIYVQNIDVMIIADAQTDLSAFDQGLTDVLGTKLSDWGKYRGSKQTNISEYPTTYFDFIGFNFNNPVLSDVMVRQAIAYSIDLDKLVDDVYHHSATRSETPINPRSWLHEPDVIKYDLDIEAAKELYKISLLPESEALPDELPEEEMPGDGIIEEETPADEISAEDTDIEELPDEAQLGDQTEAQIEECFLVILVNEENDERVKVANALAEAINRIGPTATVEILPFEEYEAKLIARDYDIFIGGINFSILPDLSFMLHSSQADAGTNYFSYKNDVMDMLLAHSFTFSTSNGYKNSMSELQKYIASELPFISVCFRNSVLLTDKKIYGEIQPRQSNIYSGIQNWFIIE